MGLTLDVDITLLLDAELTRLHRVASVLKRGAHKFALKLKHVVTQSYVLTLKTRCYSDPRLSWNAKLIRLAF